jgi:hypothetical protein
MNSIIFLMINDKKILTRIKNGDNILGMKGKKWNEK